MINDKFSVLTPHDRARIVSFFTTLSSLIYHCCVFILFLCIKVYPLFFYNIISISVFATLLFFIPKMKSYIGLYLIAAIEVIIHQILADYFLGTETSFHFFILLIGLLPFLVFEDKVKISIPITIITCVLFIVFENLTFIPKYDLPETLIHIVHAVNVSVTVIVILFMIFIYTMYVMQMENHLSKQNNMLGRELKLASNIQQNFFFQSTEGIEGWDIGYVNQAMAGVSGDMYDLYRTENVLDGFGIFDVSGHGISSGLVTMLVKNIIHKEFYQETDLETWETLLKINDRVIAEKGDIENYLTGILARVKGNKIEFVNASHPCPLLYKRATNTVEVIERPPRSMGAIGLNDFPTFYESQEIVMEKGDELLLYTDGVTDCVNADKQEYGLEKLIESFLNVIGHKADQQTYLMLNDINDFRGSTDPTDDITLMIIKK